MTKEVELKVIVVVSEDTADEIAMYKVACALDDLDVLTVRSVKLA
jgi:hypothetical protein